MYGAQAMDVIFPEGGMGDGSKVDMWDIVGHKSLRNIRVSAFTDEEMMRQKLCSFFGEDLEWDDAVLEFMIIILHADLENGHSYHYNGPASLLDLYKCAGGTKHAELMEQKLFDIQRSREKTDPLIKDLRQKFHLCRETTFSSADTPLQRLGQRRMSVKEEEKKSEEDGADLKASFTVILAASKFKRIGRIAKLDDSLTYEEFYQGKLSAFLLSNPRKPKPKRIFVLLSNVSGFLTPYHTHSASVNPLETKVVIDTLNFLDSDESGKIEWGELLSRAFWVLENEDKDEIRRWNLQE